MAAGDVSPASPAGLTPVVYGGAGRDGCRWCGVVMAVQASSVRVRVCEAACWWEHHVTTSRTRQRCSQCVVSCVQASSTSAQSPPTLTTAPRYTSTDTVRSTLHSTHAHCTVGLPIARSSTHTVGHRLMTIIVSNLNRFKNHWKIPW